LVLLAVPSFAADVDKTWAGAEWNTTWTDVSNSGACDTTNQFVYSATNGNPDNCRIATCLGRNDVSSRHSEWAGTWEGLGVTAGWTVSTVQHLDTDTKLLTDTGCDSIVFGPLELRDSSNNLVATLWSGRTATTQEESFTAEGSDSAQSVGSLTASNSNIELWFNVTMDIANAANQTCVGVIDNLDLRIVASSYNRKRAIIVGSRFDRGGWKTKSIEEWVE
jgi:hypothetical protein